MVQSRPLAYSAKEVGKASTSPEALYESCRICGYSLASPHFGVISCRPCGAFFRRSVVSKRKYHCTNENKSCNVDYRERPMCPYCRYQKTLNAGMTVKNIRLHSDKTGPIKQKPQLSHQILPVSLSILDQLTTGYNEFLEKSKEVYFVMNPKELFKNNINFQPGSLRDQIFYDRSQLYFILKMLERHFHPFGDLDKKDRMKLFEVFQPGFTRLNMLFLSLHHFPHIPGRVVLFQGGYNDEGEPEPLYTEDNNPEESCRHFSSLVAKFFKVKKRFHNLKIDITEAAAMAAIMLWNEANLLFNTDIYHNQIEKITTELKVHCNLKSNDDGIRLGQILCCFRDIEELQLLVKTGCVLAEMINDYDIPIMHQDVYKWQRTFFSLG